MKRDLVIVGVLWLVLTIIGEYFAVVLDFFPTFRSDKGEEIDSAFRVLVYFAVPVCAGVVAALVYSVLAHRTPGVPEQDGPPMHGRGAVPLVWFGASAVLTLIVMIYPGLIGISAIFGEDSDPDLVVEVQGVQWTWFVSYPDQGVSGVRELVLPVDRSVRFDVTSPDVLHSFWVPAFGMKIDAVPGRTTTVSLTPTKLGSFETDQNMRLQCAELCGLQHSTMQIPVSVVTDAEFEAWLLEQAETVEPSDGTPIGADAQEFTVVGRNIVFDKEEILAEPERQVAITFDNQDEGVPHNWALYESEQAADSGDAAIALSPIEPGLLVQEIVFDAPEPGAYFYRCDVHPTTMTGTLVVE
jgi:cytochrome c oxidase subunit II